jgi:hypothetical protein
MHLLNQDQRFQLANRLLDIVQTLMVKETAAETPPDAFFQGNIPSDDFKVDEFDKNLEDHALNFLNIEGDEDGQ